MKDKNWSVYYSPKTTIPVDIRGKKDFLVLLEKDKELAREYFEMNMTPFAYSIASPLVKPGTTVGSVVQKAMKKSWKKIHKFKGSNLESLNDWCRNFIKEESKKF